MVGKTAPSTTPSSLNTGGTCNSGMATPARAWITDGGGGISACERFMSIVTNMIGSEVDRGGDSGQVSFRQPTSSMSVLTRCGRNIEIDGALKVFLLLVDTTGATVCKILRSIKTNCSTVSTYL